MHAIAAISTPLVAARADSQLTLPTAKVYSRVLSNMVLWSEVCRSPIQESYCSIATFPNPQILDLQLHVPEAGSFNRYIRVVDSNLVYTIHGHPGVCSTA
jgi:hypothetical protein